MLTEEELKIIGLFRKNIFNSYTIREIMKRISKASYSWVFNAVKKINKLGILTLERKGKSLICRINLDNSFTLIYLSFLEELKANLKKVPLINIKKLIDSIPLSYFTFIVSGSYAKGKATKESDLDIVVLIEDNENIKKILTILKNKSEFMAPPIHPYIFTKTEFIKMLLSKEENYGKFIYRNRLIFFGAQNYYLILKEAIENGFRGC